MEIRTGKGMLVVGALLTVAFVGWQLADDGLKYAKGRLPALVGNEGNSVSAIAFRARYEANQRTYWLLTNSSGGPSQFYRVVVLYGLDGRPYEARIL